MTITLKHI